MNSEGEERVTASLAHLYATVDRSVADLRSGEITGRDVRAIASERRRKHRDAWMMLRGAARDRSSS